MASFEGRAPLSSRAPDAAQRFFSGALQSRGHVAALDRVAFWVPALRRTACALLLVRDTRERRRCRLTCVDFAM